MSKSNGVQKWLQQKVIKLRLISTWEQKQAQSFYSDSEKEVGDGLEIGYDIESGT